MTAPKVAITCAAGHNNPKVAPQLGRDEHTNRDVVVHGVLGTSTRGPRELFRPYLSASNNVRCT